MMASAIRFNQPQAIEIWRFQNYATTLTIAPAFTEGPSDPQLNSAERSE
jgi:D-alanyl-lipoteichoic acid acyltransferase DltB (MBOAT superfamily)